MGAISFPSAERLALDLGLPQPIQSLLENRIEWGLLWLPFLHVVSYRGIPYQTPLRSVDCVNKRTVLGLKTATSAHRWLCLQKMSDIEWEHGFWLLPTHQQTASRQTDGVWSGWDILQQWSPSGDQSFAYKKPFIQIWIQSQLLFVGKVIPQQILFPVLDKWMSSELGGRFIQQGRLVKMEEG